MPINPSLFKKILEKNKLVSEEELKKATITAKHLGCSVIDVLIGRGHIKETDLKTAFATYYEVPYINLNDYRLNAEILNTLPYPFSLDKNVLVFDKKENTIHIAMDNPKDLEAIELIKKYLGGGSQIKIYFCLTKEIKEGQRYYQKKSENFSPEISQKKPSDTVKTIEEILDEAMLENASDIHIEPLADNTLIRFRIDGVLHDRKTLSLEIHPSFVARIKVLSDLKLDEHRLPQDGRFSYTSKAGGTISLRVSIMPTVYGEKIVLRILEDTLTRLNLENLGLLPEDQQLLEKIMDRTHGMFLVTGPTGSGKTTTLYTILGLLNKPGVNIITIEDPVENRIRRISQTQVNNQIDLTFAKGLRSILRQDPDIIMVGEIRDQETAVIGVNAAMTGHLVFSSVHANNAANAIPRMLDLGIEPFLLASTLNMVIAQRLVRILCPYCKEEIPLTQVLKERLLSLSDIISPDIFQLVDKNYLPKGCSKCSNTGFKNRTGIYELIIIDDLLKEMIVHKETASKIRQYSRSKSSKSMIEDGLIKVSKGITTIEEVFRVISE